jgi:hypothetical protein
MRELLDHQDRPIPLADHGFGGCTQKQISQEVLSMGTDQHDISLLGPGTPNDLDKGLTHCRASGYSEAVLLRPGFAFLT